MHLRDTTRSIKPKLKINLGQTCCRIQSFTKKFPKLIINFLENSKSLIYVALTFKLYNRSISNIIRLHLTYVSSFYNILSQCFVLMFRVWAQDLTSIYGPTKKLHYIQYKWDELHNFRTCSRDLVST